MPDKSFIHDKKDKNWWANFWYYYKIHVVVAIIVIIVVAFSIAECVNKVNPDLSICYIGGKYFNDEVSQNIDDTFSKFVNDVDNRHGSVAYFYQINLSKDPKSEQDFAMQQRALLEVAAGESYLYILDKEIYDQYLKEGIFADISSDLGLSGEVYGIPLDDNELMSKLGIANGNFYAAVREVGATKQNDKKELARKQNAINVIKELKKYN